MITEKTFMEVAQQNQFSWANADIDFQSHIIREFQTERIYDWFYQVQLGDIVVDIGASVGPFSMMSAERNAAKIFVIEPNKLFLKTALFNCGNYLFNRQQSHIIPVNYAISNNNENIIVFGEEECIDFIPFKSLITLYNINHIDFLKIDCEGGEYNIFIEENVDFLKTVKHIAVEIHLRYDSCREKFIHFRDNVLSQFSKWEARSCTFNPIEPGMFVDLKPYLYDDEFIETYQREFMIYIGENCDMNKKH